MRQGSPGCLLGPATWRPWRKGGRWRHVHLLPHKGEDKGRETAPFLLPPLRSQPPMLSSPLPAAILRKVPFLHSQELGTRRFSSCCSSAVCSSRSSPYGCCLSRRCGTPQQHLAAPCALTSQDCTWSYKVEPTAFWHQQWGRRSIRKCHSPAAPVAGCKASAPQSSVGEPDLDTLPRVLSPGSHRGLSCPLSPRISVSRNALHFLFLPPPGTRRAKQSSSSSSPSPGKIGPCPPRPAQAVVVPALLVLVLQGSLDTARALWLGRDVIAVDWAALVQEAQGGQVLLHASRAAALSLSEAGLQGTSGSQTQSHPWHLAPLPRCQEVAGCSLFCGCACSLYSHCTERASSLCTEHVLAHGRLGSIPPPLSLAVLAGAERNFP